MSLQFRYKPIPVGHAVLALGGRWVRPRPIVTVSVIGPANTWVRPGILDTAADDTIFPEFVAGLIGQDLTNAPAGSGAGVGLASVPLRYAEVTLRLTDGREQREWPAWVGFTPVRLTRPLLGFAGFLQFFDVHFRGGREEVELAVNALYRGT